MSLLVLVGISAHPPPKHKTFSPHTLHTPSHPPVNPPPPRISPRPSTRRQPAHSAFNQTLTLSHSSNSSSDYPPLPRGKAKSLQISIKFLQNFGRKMGIASLKKYEEFPPQAPQTEHLHHPPLKDTLQPTRVGGCTRLHNAKAH